METLYVDNTLLSMVAKCSTLAVTRGVLGYTSKEESANLKAGSACHAGWACYFKGGSADEAMAAIGACEEFEAWAAANVETGDRLAYANVARVMGRWFETHPRERLPFSVRPDRVEVYVEAELEPGLWYCGIMDALGTYEQGDYNIENKTTGRLDALWLRSQRLSAQISGYHWLGGQLLGRPLTGTFLNVQELAKLPSDPVRKCKEHGVAYSECGTLHAKSEIAIVTRTPTAIEQWRRTAINLGRKYRELLKYSSLEHIDKVRMQGTVNNSCRWCQFSEWCYNERSAAFAAANFTHDAWEPKERALARVGASE